MGSLRPAVVLGAAGLLLLSACVGTGNEAASSDPTVTNAPSTRPADLPSGDPGLDASAVPDPGAPKGFDADHGHARKVVPLEAMLGSAMVAQVLGGQWQESAAPPLECVSDLGEVAERTVLYQSTGGTVLQTVATHRSPVVADHAVGEMSRRLHMCGWTIHPDPRLGSASAAASSRRSTRSAVVIAAEGVTLTMVGSDRALTQVGRWSSLIDVALGNSCAAAPDGCH